METLSRTLGELLHTANTERLRSPLLLLEGAKTTAHKGAQRLSNVYSNHELDGGQNTLIVCPNTQKH